MTRQWRWILALGIVVAGAPGVAAQDAEIEKAYAVAQKEIPGISKDLLVAAKKEGKLVAYHLVIPFAALLKEYSARFPFIKIETFQGSGPPVYQKFTTEQRAGVFRVDVWQHSDPGQTNEVVREGLLAEYKILADAKVAEGTKNSGNWYPVALARIGISYNPTVLSKEDIEVLRKEGWDTLTNPRWRGKAGLMQLVGGAGTLPYYYEYKEKGADFLQKAFDNKPTIFSANATAIERLVAGEYGVLFNSLEGTAHVQYKNGAPVEYIIPDPVLLVPFTQAIAKNAPHPNSARLFQEWFFSAAGQKIWQETSGYVSANSDVPDTRDVAKESWYRAGKTMWNWKFDEMVATTPELRALLEKIAPK